MGHNIDFSTGYAAIAFRGSRDNIWHRHGYGMAEGETIAQWAEKARLDWTAEKCPIFADVNGEMVRADGWRSIVRSDTRHVLGIASDRYQPVQPIEVLNWFDQYLKVDDRFQLDVAGSLKAGEIIWATATYNGELDVAGDKHVARLLMTTTFDGSGATINRATMTRVVCNNALDCALADKQKSLVRTRHSTKFDAAKVGRELANVVSGFAAYKAMGDAMATVHLDNDKLSQFMKACLDIPFDAKRDEISTRKFNQFDELRSSYGETVREGTEPGTAWSALNAVTRYVDHERSTRGDAAGESRFVSAQFGSGAAMKQKAVDVLFEMSDGALLKAVGEVTAEKDQDYIRDMLAQPFRPALAR